jgi:hypothetical protein
VERGTCLPRQKDLSVKACNFEITPLFSSFFN